MQLFRVAPQRFARDTSGDGAKLYGGRWNPKGIPVLYATTTRSLAVLEALVHASPNQGPPSRMLVTLEVPESVSRKKIDLKTLPENWNRNPPPPSLANIGRKWAESAETLLLLVPSAVLPLGDEMNVLINPQHPEFGSMKIAETLPFVFDDRLFSNQRTKD